MTNLQEIEKSIMSLQNDEKISFRQWFIKFDNDSMGLRWNQILNQVS